MVREPGNESYRSDVLFVDCRHSCLGCVCIEQSLLGYDGEEELLLEVHCQNCGTYQIFIKKCSILSLQLTVESILRDIR